MRLLAILLFFMIIALPAQAMQPSTFDPGVDLIRVAANSDPNTALQLLAEAAKRPEYRGRSITITIHVTPNLTPAQVEWVNRHWRDNNVYIIVDRQGVAWLVGQGHYPRPTTIQVRVEIGSYCYAASGAGAVLQPIGFSGMIGGTSSTTVTWNIYNYTDSQYWAQFNFTGNIQVEAGWIPTGSPGPDCNNPYLSSFSYVQRYGWTISGTEWTTTYAGYPAFTAQVQLPPAGDYVFYWIIHAQYYDVNGTQQPFHVIYYWGNVTNQDPQEETNTLLGAILNAIKNIASQIFDVLKQFFQWIIDQLQQLLPPEILAFLGFLKDLASAIIDLVTAFASNLSIILPFISLFAQLLPVIIITIIIADPLRVIEIIRWIIDILSKIISAIRNLLPIP